MESDRDDPGMAHLSDHVTPNASAQPLGSDAPIDLGETLIAFRRLLGDIAAETNETPRSILENEFKQAPSDEFWRAKLGAER